MFVADVFPVLDATWILRHQQTRNLCGPTNDPRIAEKVCVWFGVWVQCYVVRFQIPQGRQKVSTMMVSSPMMHEPPHLSEGQSHRTLDLPETT